jgi:hypothetical protein
VIIIACKDCGTAVRVTGENDQLSHLVGELNQDWYPDKYPCPTAQCAGKAEFMEGIEPSAMRMLTIHDLTPHEAFAAFNGLGLPGEQDCGPTAVREVLLTNKVKAVDTRLIRGSHRSVIYSLTLEDGTILYLGSSSFGATVYRISKVQSAVKRLHGEG